jgi:hypothetical protein
MRKRILCLMASLVFLAYLVPLSHGGGIVFQIGDKDGFGFAPEELVGVGAIGGDFADTDGDGKLEPGEFLPERGGRDDHFDECPPPDGDGFDHRSDEEKAGMDGLQFTDVSYRVGEGGECLGHTPMNTTYFEFDLSVEVENPEGADTFELYGLPIESAKLQLIYSDFDGDCPSECTSCVEICDDVFADGQFIGEVPLTDPTQGGISKARFEIPLEVLEDDFVRITFESSDSIEYDAATLNVKVVSESVRPLINLRVKSETPDPTPVPGGPWGTVVVTYRLRNKSATPIMTPYLKFKPQDGDIILLNADGGPKAKGAKFTPDVGPDAVLAPEEKVLFDLVIGLLSSSADPDFKVKILGTPLE